MPVSFEQVLRNVTEQAEEVCQIFNRALWTDAYSANREYVFSFVPLNQQPPFEIFGESRFRWDVNQLVAALEPPPMDEEGNPVDDSFLDLEASILLPPFSALPDLSKLRKQIVSWLPQYNPPLFSLSQDYNIDAPAETVYHLKLDYLWSFEGEARILTARYADIYHDMSQLIRELNRERGGWQTAHYA